MIYVNIIQLLHKGVGVNSRVPEVNMKAGIGLFMILIDHSHYMLRDKLISHSTWLHNIEHSKYTKNIDNVWHCLFMALNMLLIFIQPDKRD